MICIADALKLSATLDSDTARLDTELLLCRVLGRNRTYLYTWPDRALAEAQWQAFQVLLQRRQAGEPVAHILGEREFWSLRLRVNNSTLIPRPATEVLVQWALDNFDQAPRQLLDLGTGTGAIALALASERPRWRIAGIDQSADAVALATDNAQQLGLANCRFWQSHWFEKVGDRYELIVSNPPYIDAEDPHLAQGDVRFEPRSALVAGEQGLADLRTIARDARAHLETGGWLCLEHSYQQAEAVRQLLIELGYINVDSQRDLDHQPRISFGQWPAAAQEPSHEQ